MNTKLELWRKRKAELHLTNKDIASIANLPLRTVEQVMCGTVQSPRLDTVQAIERALELGEWSKEEKAQGVEESEKVTITAVEDELLTIGREVQEKLGEEALRAYIQIGESILNNINKE